MSWIVNNCSEEVWDIEKYTQKSNVGVSPIYLTPRNFLYPDVNYGLNNGLLKYKLRLKEVI